MCAQQRNQYHQKQLFVTMANPLSELGTIDIPPEYQHVRNSNQFCLPLAVLFVNQEKVERIYTDGCKELRPFQTNNLVKFDVRPHERLNVHRKTLTALKIKTQATRPNNGNPRDVPTQLIQMCTQLGLLWDGQEFKCMSPPSHMQIWIFPEK